jgi:hypothetical protein
MDGAVSTRAHRKRRLKGHSELRWRDATISRNDVSTTSTPAITRAITRGSGSPRIQPAAAVTLAAARKTRRTPRTSVPRSASEI